MAGADEPLSSNPKVYECLGSDDCAVPCDVNMVALADYERLRHELDNERSAMRNVQECAESYRRKVEKLQKIALEDALTIELSEDRAREIERLRAALERLCNAADDVGVRHFDHDSIPASVVEMQQATLAARAALRPADETEESK